MQEGDKVTYIPTGEIGIVKFPSTEEGKVFVVYKCREDWENYKNYTGVSTPITSLKLGWE